VSFSLYPEGESEKRFVHSTSLPREKQARATLQRSEAARCLSQENDSKRTKKRNLPHQTHQRKIALCLQSQSPSFVEGGSHIMIDADVLGSPSLRNEQSTSGF